MVGICRVCELIDKDKEGKYVEYCKTCDALICSKCRPDMLRRAKAALMDKFIK